MRKERSATMKLAGSPFESNHTVMLRAAVISAGIPLTWDKICEYSGLSEEEFFAALPEALKVGRMRLAA